MYAPRRLMILLTLAAVMVSFGLNTSAGAAPGQGGGLAEKENVRNTGWELVWADEFDGSEIDPDNWGHEVNCWGGGNNERQCYTDRDANSFVEDGRLVINALKEEFSGPAVQDDDPSYPGGEKTQDYTSARLRTKGKFDFRYGRVDVRAKLPGGQGIWPAIWMLPTDNVYGGWPLSGEIDILEAVNLPDPATNFTGWGDVLHGTLHYGLPWPQWENHGASKALDYTLTDDFHTFSLEWEPGEIRWYLDGEHWQTQRDEGWYNYVWGGQDVGFEVANKQAPFDERFHLLLNLAVGGDWPQDPNPDAPFWADGGREMLVDYVRVYQCGRDANSQACATKKPGVKVNRDASAGAPATNEYQIFDGGPKTLRFDVDDVGRVTNTPVPGSWAAPGVTVTSDPAADGWAIDFAQTGSLDWGFFGGNVFLTAQDMSSVEGVENGLSLAGGSGWTINGELSFDLTVNEIAEGTTLLVKMDSGYPNVGFKQIDPPAPGESARVNVKIADLLANFNAWEAPLQAENINNLFVLESTGPANVVVDDIRLECAYNTEPEDWQIDKTCALTPRVPAEPLHEIFIDNVTITPAGNFTNGDFSSGLAGWENWTGAGGSASIVEDNEAAKISVFAQGSETWSIQFYQPFDLSPGYYEVSFDARSTADRTIEVTLEDGSFVRHMDLDAVLTDQWDTYVGSFTWPEGATGSSIKFLVGAEP